MMTTRQTLTLIRFGSAKTLTRAQLPFGQIEAEDPSDRYGV
jgi:hypothetical protein